MNEAVIYPPTSNTGGLPKSEAFEHFVVVKGQLKEVLLKRGKSTAAFIDTLTVVMPESVFVRPDQLGTEEEVAAKDWENGGYTSRHTKPIAECVGGDWLHYLGTGKTLYIGSRKNSSRFVRVYEKGKQLGDSESPWVRVELELHNRDIVIPHEILIDAGQYLTGAFPVFERLFSAYEEAPAKVERVKKQQDVSAEHCVKYGAIQVSGVVNLLERMGLDAEAIVEVLKDGKKKCPAV